MLKNKLTEEEQLFIVNNVKGKQVSELTDLFNKQFNKNITETQIRNFKKRNKLKSGVNTKFCKNQTPHNYKPVGSEFADERGYVYIKIADPNEWITKQRYVYEKHIGIIPKGHSVIFADSNKRNFDVDNLILARNKDKLVAKNKHLIFDDADLTKTGLLIAKLINDIHEKQIGGNNENIKE